MPIVRRTSEAEEDLIDIWLYIAQDNPVAADQLLDDLDDKCFLLAENPLLGPARPDIAPELRYFPVGNYLILYLKGLKLFVSRMAHGRCPTYFNF